MKVADETKQMMSVVVTKSDRIKDLAIDQAQLVFIQDKGIIALDWKGSRRFYSDIIEIDSEVERKAMTNPDTGFYFVLETAVMWSYHGQWQQMTTPPNENIVFVGVEERPEIGTPRTLYVSTTEGNENISVWNETKDEYQVVADKTHSVTFDDIDALFLSA